MKTFIFNRRGRAAGLGSPALGLAATLLCAASLLLAPLDLMAGYNGVVVDTLTGGPSQFSPPYSGYVDGDTAEFAQFHTPFGLALDSTGESLFVADRDNDAIRLLDLPGNETFTYVPIDGITPAGTINNPVGLALDADDNLYVLNYGNGTDGTLLRFDYYDYGYWFTNIAAGLVNAQGLVLDAGTNIYITVNNNTVLKISPTAGSSVLATIPDAGTLLRGICVMSDGNLAVCDSGRHGILSINPTTGAVTNITGFNGAGDNTFVANLGIPKGSAKFNQPYGIAGGANGVLVVADYGNHRVKVVNAVGTVTNLYGVSSNYWVTGSGTWPGWWDGNVWVPDTYGTVEARNPNGVLIAGNSSIYVTEDYYHLIRKVTGHGITPMPPPPPPAPGAPTIWYVLTNYGQVTLAWTTVPGADSYNVKRSPSSGGPYTVLATVASTNYTDNSVLDGTTYYYVVSALGAGGEGPISAEVPVWTPLPPVDDPEIGWVDFPPPFFDSFFHPVSSFVLNNDTPIIIVGVAGSQTFYTYGPTASGVPDPTPASASAPAGYQDGLSPAQVAFFEIGEAMPDLTIKAVGTKADGSPNSAIVQARFQFVTANPTVTGNNAAQFTVSDITTDAEIWYTQDGTDPTNGAPSLGPISSGTSLSLDFPGGQSNLTFKAIAFRGNYQPSAVVSYVFSPTNFIPNTISFGFASGEASSAFIGSAGQTFYAPVTLSPLPDTEIYSLQFNVTVTNAGGNPGPAVTPGAVLFDSMLLKPIPNTNPVLYTNIPPYMYVGSGFQDLRFTNSLGGSNLLGVGWLERFSMTNLYDTTKQTLIDFSMAHDTLFEPALGKVVLGGYAFQVPTTATGGQTYQIQIGRPSATSDGIGAPGSDVYIATPTNGSLAAGAINSIKVVTVGQIKYTAGDCAPFRWFNAGDFGNTPTNKLDNSDVMQVFQSAIYSLNYPPIGSDFEDSMNSCGRVGVAGPGGYLVPGPASDPTVLFDGNDTTINDIAFGDLDVFGNANLDVCDVYVTFRRSLDPSLAWFQRFWTNGTLAAELIGQPNYFYQPQGGPLKGSSFNPANLPSVNFAAGDALATAGQVLYIPITAKIFGDYPLRVLMLNLTVEPLDGSPALTSPVQFTPNAALGAPTLTSSTGNGNFAASWLNNAIAGLTGDATLGTLRVIVPPSATSSAAYAIHFEHASASPNGIASFSDQALTGLILLSDRSGSSFNDGIPDSWRLRYFGTVNNMLSQAAADADGDRANSWQEYIAGTDPVDAKSLLSAATASGNAQQPQDCVVRWPSVSNKQYVIERAASLFGAPWTPVGNLTGTGGNMEFHDLNGGNVRFYRVRVTP